MGVDAQRKLTPIPSARLFRETFLSNQDTRRFLSWPLTQNTRFDSELFGYRLADIEAYWGVHVASASCRLKQGEREMCDCKTSLSHRSVLQPTTVTSGARLSKPGGVRAGGVWCVLPLDLSRVITLAVKSHEEYHASSFVYNVTSILWLLLSQIQNYSIVAYSGKNRCLILSIFSELPLTT